MDLNTKKIIKGRTTIYKTEFTRMGSLSKLIENLKIKESPINGISVVKISEISDSEIQRIMTSSLPNTTIVSNIIGNVDVNVTYNIAYNDKILVSKAVNPSIINSYFKFDEELTVEEEGEFLKFTRETIIFNAGKQIPLIGDSFQEYDDFFNNQNLSYYLHLAEISSL